MKPIFLKLPLTAALLLGAVFAGLPNYTAYAQTSAGIVVGTVTDATGAVIPDAVVTLTDVSTKATRTVRTNKEGAYAMPDVQPGTYNISASKSGFSTDMISEQVVSVGTQTTANFKMMVGAENTTVEVTATNADLQTMNASTGNTVDPAMTQSLPAIGRDVATFATLQPGVSPAGMVAGVTQDQATFTLDGGSNTSDMDGTNGVYTTSGVNSITGGFLGAPPGGVIPMTQDSVEEFKVTTTGQTADFNNSAGSQSQVTTKRGRDHWHGTAYEYYLDSNIGANSWANNFPGALYTPKASYHYSRFGASAGGPIIPTLLGGKTYFFANYEGYRYPAASTITREVPSYEYLQLGQLSLGTSNGTNYSATQLTALDPRHLGMSPTLKTFYNTQLPVAPMGNSGNTGAGGQAYAGTFDPSCGSIAGTLCDSKNTIAYRVNVRTPLTSNALTTRVDHDFGQKWHAMASYRYYNYQTLTSNQVDIGGALPGDTVGVPTAKTPRPQQPWYLVVGLTTNISSSLTNDFHYSYLRNGWQWLGAGAPPQIAGAGGVLEPLGEYQTTVLAPYNVNAQNIRTRIWDGKDNFFSDNLTKLKGDHFIQFGGQYQHNFNYHQRTDNGASINYTPTYQLGDTGGGGNITYTGLGSAIGTGSSATANSRMVDTYFGFVTDTQVANTYANNGGTLNLNAPATPFGAHTTVPYYNIYVTDTWHAKRGLTINYGLSYALEMPPQERDGNQVMFTDQTGNAIYMKNWLAQRKAAALTGAVYNPYVGFALIKNVQGGRKYAYDPYYKALSPRVSVAWNPKFSNPSLSRIFGDGATVVRAGYGRLFGRINGSTQVLNPLLSPGLVLATQCKFLQSAATGSGGCTQTNYNDTTAFRFGSSAGFDGLSPATANAAVPAVLAQPYRPGLDGPSVQLASPIDPSTRPDDVDTFNFSIQRQINRRMTVEVGYIGRLIHNDYIMENPNQVPYMLTQGGQSFMSAYMAIEGAFGCSVSASLCSKSATPTNITPQPFFETALAGTGYCTGATSCTQAVVNKQTANLRNQKVFSVWQALDNNVGGAQTGGGFIFPRSLMGTPTSNGTYGSAGQIVSGMTVGTSVGYGNYNGGYVSFKASGFHGLTLQENLTISKALGLGSYNQTTSSIALEDSFNPSQQYGRQGFDQKVIFNTFIVYELPWYKSQSGIVGRLAGGWVLSPVLTAGSGQPLTCTTNNSGQNFGGEDGANITDSESCIFNTQYTGGAHTHRGIFGGVDPNGISVGTNTKLLGSPAASVNMFTDPVGVYDSVRPPILGLDPRSTPTISNLGYLNVDLSVRKTMRIYEKYSIEFSGIMSNVMNHLDFGSPGLSLQSTTNWGNTKTQGNSPRQIQMGLRASF